MRKHGVNILLFIIALFVLGGMNMTLNLTNTKKLEVSEAEKRVLKQMPEFSFDKLFDGSFFSEFDEYFADNFVFREKFIKLSASINNFRGISASGEVEIFAEVSGDQFNSQDEKVTLKQENLDGKKINNDSASDAIEKAMVEANDLDNKGTLSRDSANTNGTNTNANTNTNDVNNNVTNANNTNSITATDTKKTEQGTDNSENITDNIQATEEEQGELVNYTLIIKNTAMETFTYKEEAEKFYADAINQFQKRVNQNPERKVNVYSMVLPSQIEFVKGEKYKSLSRSQFEAINYLNSCFNSEITAIDAYSALKQRSNEYIYFRTDHHWTALGAYYAYCKFMETTGRVPMPLESFEISKAEKFLGSLYEKTCSTKLKENPDTVFIYKPFVKSDYKIYENNGTVLERNVINMEHAKGFNKYLVFISGDNPLGIIKTEVKNGKKILVFKDSYGNAFIPYLVNHYEEIHIIDPRHYEKNAAEYVINNDIQDVMFLNYSIVISYYNGYAKNIIKVMK